MACLLSLAGTQEYGKDRPVPQPLDRGRIGRVQERLRLPGGKPVPQTHPFGSNPFHARDAIGQLGRQQPVVCCLDRQLTDSRNPDIN